MRQYERLPILQFKCSLAEDTFFIVAGKIRQLISDGGKYSEEDFTELQEGDTNENLTDFIRGIKTSSKLQDAFSKYSSLVTERGSELEELMQCLSDIIFMEVSCGKEPWYKREELYEQANGALGRLKELNQIDEDIKVVVTKYYEKLLKMYK